MNNKKLIDFLPVLKLYFDKKLGLNVSYRYVEENKELPILFLHGFNGNSKSWAHQFKYFKNKRSVIAIDFPGFGNSSALDTDMETIANMFIRLLKTLNISSFQIVGHSMGGMLAQVIAINYEKLVDKLILSCTHNGFAISKEKPLGIDYLKRIEQRKKLTNKEFGKIRVSKMFAESKIINKETYKFLASISEEITEGAISSGGIAMQTLDTSKSLQNLSIECLIITATEDIIVSEKQKIALKNSIPKAISKELLNLGHAPYCEDPESFNNLLEEFL
ncbi:alpha/beta hydrolase [Alphaproteobacteria bacterium]|nr:alpha/beta hydrolase [Alphaproteobacteria bacterium]